MNALQKNAYSDAWSAIGKQIARPQAILMISAHWYTHGLFVTAMQSPRTIHDFGGFPRELYEVTYPAPGDPALARRVQKMLTPLSVALDLRWGLDHGTWSVLCHLFPRADIPVIQLSIDRTQPPAWHYELGKRLAPLRDEGVLILGSGNLVHNLALFNWETPDIAPYDWATRFELFARESMLAGDDAPLIAYETSGHDAMLCAPTPDHYLPLLPILALRRQNEPICFPVQGFDGGSVSMLAVQIGQ